MHTASPNTKTRDVTNTQDHVAWKVFPSTKRQLTCKCIVNNNADNINALTTLISLKNTQNWLKVHHNSKPPMQYCTQYHVQSDVSRENAFWLVSRSRDSSSMEKKWDTVKSANLRTLFVSGTCMSRWFLGTRELIFFILVVSKCNSCRIIKSTVHWYLV